MKKEIPQPPLLKGELNQYQIGDKTFCLQNDFTYAELEWLDVMYARLNPSPSGRGQGEGMPANEISGSFTRDEIEKTLQILLSPPLLKGVSPQSGEGGFTHEDFLNTRETLSVKIIADFFLSKAILGYFIKTFLTN
jgi:hypothetical protein